MYYLYHIRVRACVYADKYKIMLSDKYFPDN